MSFYSPAANANIWESGIRSGHSITIRSEYVAHLPADQLADERLHLWADSVEATPYETAVGRLLYVHLETAKTQLRGLPVNKNTLETRAALLDAVATQTLAGNAALVCFVAYVDEFIQRISN